MSESRFRANSISRACGFTLIEVLVSTVIGVILVVAVLGVLRNLLRKESMPPPAISSILAEQLRHDFSNAKYFRKTSRGVEILGPVSRSAAGDLLWTPGSVAFEVRRVNEGETGVLTRRDSSPNERGAGELLWLGVGGVQVDSFVLDESDLPISPQAKAQGWQPLASSFELSLFDDRGNLWHRESIVRNGVVRQ
ncbi:MAG: prepilin-type N-terminal cleavage/methylation domain-containing protein [Planctomycetota bacterium]|nr:prepilin-type N-terminal cleavage/methylation domain-containing protein [Planctomycetota bacterium]